MLPAVEKRADITGPVSTRQTLTLSALCHSQQHPRQHPLAAPVRMKNSQYRCNCLLSHIMLVSQNSVLNAGILLSLFCHFKIQSCFQLSQSNYLLLYQLIFTALSINHNGYDIPTFSLPCHNTRRSRANAGNSDHS